MKIFSTPNYLLSLILTTIVLLNACRVNHPHLMPANNSFTNPYNEPIDSYLEYATTAAAAAEKQTYQIKAATRLLENHMDKRAEQIMTEINSETIPAALQDESLLLESELALNKQHPKRTLILLSQLENKDLLLPYQQLKYHQLLAKAHEQTNHPLESTQYYLQLLQYPQDEVAQAYYQEKVWDNLSQLSLHNLQTLQTRLLSAEAKGWVELAYIPKHDANNWQQMQQSLEHWSKIYPNHPGNHIIKENIGSATLIPPIKQIALLLPLHGELTELAQAVQDGFMAAYYQMQLTNPSNVNLRIYDTSQDIPIAKTYRQAIDDGADFVVGPLDKKQTQAIAKSRIISVPTLALNYPSKSKQIENLYHFGLSPLDEAVQITEKAWHDGYRKAIVIMPESEWGQALGQTFTQNWQQRGGEVVGKLAYAQSQDLHHAVKSLLNLDKSEARERQLQQIIKQTLKFTPRRREDADFIFLIAFPSTARQIHPLLKYYYAGELPIYAPSIIYSGKPDPIKDSDLNGVIFSEIPWILTHIDKHTKSKTSIKNNNINTYSINYYTRLYALGYDAYTLVNQMNQLVLFPRLSVAGQTGTLYLNRGQINRELQWAQFKDGTPQAI